jgi:hypothetical protein
MARMMMYAACLYGAKALQNFTAPHSITNMKGDKGQYFEEFCVINREFGKLGNTLMALDSKFVFHSSDLLTEKLDTYKEGLPTDVISDSTLLDGELPARTSVGELHDEYGNKTVVLHGVCIGSATALYALISPQRLDYMVGMVAEGMYTNFRETTKNHMQEKKQMIYPYLDIIMLYFRIATKQNAIKYGPIKVIKNLKTPILFIYSKQDNYSRPDKAQLLYDACGSPDKRIAWFEKGRHSRVRINDQEGYDKSVLDFLETYFSK